MTLGEALSLRARQAQRLNDLQGRIKMNAVVQEGEEAPESVGTLLEEYLNLSEEHSALLIKIANTNAETSIDPGTTLLDLLHERADLIRKRNIHGMTAVSASPSRDLYRYSRSEIKYVSQVDVAEMRREEDALNDLVTTLDAKIQATNWQTDLSE